MKLNQIKTVFRLKADYLGGMKFALLFNLLVVLATASISLRAHAQGGELIKPALTDAPQTADTSSDKVAKVPTTWDDQKTSSVLNNLAKQSGWFPNLKIGVSNGVVSIEGHTKDSNQLAWLAKTADRLPTVIAVINKASVDQPPVTDLTPAWNEFLRLVNKAKRGLPVLALAILLFSVFFFISRYIYKGIHRLWGRQINNPFLLSTVTKITMVPVWLVLFYLVLQTAGLSGLATTIIGGTGAVGIILGFAFKDIAENYLSGLLLAIRSPFTKGDDVTVAGYDGFVQALNMRGTTILAYDGTLILVPNSIVIQSVIKNRSTNPRSRLTFNVAIGYNDSSAKAIDLIYKALDGIPAVLKDPAPLVIASDITTTGVVLQARFWIDASKSSGDKTKSTAIACAKESLLANGITIPDTAREVIFADALKVQQIDSSEKAKEVKSQINEELRHQASLNLRETHSNRDDSNVNHEEQIKRLGDGVDIMDGHADRHLMQNASL